MYVKIDWVSFTIPIQPGLAGSGDDAATFVERLLFNFLGGDSFDDLFSLPYSNQGGRAPYGVRMMRSDNHVNVLWGEKMNHVLVEVSGSACDLLQEQKKLLQLVKIVRPRLSRLDVACDMETDATPEDFVSSLTSAKYKTLNVFNSPSGSTVYIGAKQSDRYARVYRYSKPHPRSHLLRCEYVLKKRNAQVLAGELLQSSVVAVAAFLGSAYGWKHEAWSGLDATTIKPPGWRRDRPAGKTEAWLISQALPALARLMKEGEIADLSTWLAANLAPLMNK